MDNNIRPTNKRKYNTRERRASKKMTMQLLSAIWMIIMGSGLIIAGFIVPPYGEIHPSILVAFGEILTFVGALFGIDYHYKDKNHNM